MLATLTSKGQVTLPKAIRDALQLDAGAKLEFRLEADGTVRVHALKRSVTAIVGLLHDPKAAPASVDDLRRARDAHLAEKHERIRRETAAAPRPRRKGRSQGTGA